MKLTEYEDRVLDEIARHRVEPGPVTKLLALAGKPVDKLLEASRTSKHKAIRNIATTIEVSIEKALMQTIKIARMISADDRVLSKFRDRGCTVRSHADIRVGMVDLETMDNVADCFDLSNAVILGMEGAVLGVATTLAEGVPGAQFLIPTLVGADVAASMTLLSRHAAQIAAAYGYSTAADSANIPHVIAAMAPQTQTSDEGYLTAKAYVIDSIREAGKFMAKAGNRQVNKVLLDKEAPTLVRLIRYVAQRLGVVITEKELGMLVPVAGAVLNGGVNVAFQRAGHISAKDYFRLLTLSEKYGAQPIERLIQERVDSIQS